jgi:hypothetical protein
MKKKRYLLLSAAIAALICLLLTCGCSQNAAAGENLDSAPPSSASSDEPQQDAARQDDAEPDSSGDYYDVGDVEEVAADDIPDIGEDQYGKYIQGLESDDTQQDAPAQNGSDGKDSGKTSKKDSSKDGVKDRYKTDPVPKDKPQPKEPQDQAVDKEESLTCTLLIECGTILDNMDKFDEAKVSILPKDGVVYAKRKVTFYKGESVFDILVRETKNNKIHMEFTNTPAYNSAYIEGIANLYEFDAGNLSGWMYAVNGWYPNYGCSRYQVKDGDAIAWRYTCDLGRDLSAGIDG